MADVLTSDSLDWDGDLDRGTIPFFAEDAGDTAFDTLDDDVEAELAELAAEEGLPDIDADSPDPWDEEEPPSEPRDAGAALLRSVMPNPNAAVSTFAESSVRDERVALGRAESEVRGLTQAHAAALASAAETRRAHLVAEDRLQALGCELEQLLVAQEATANEPDQGRHLWPLVDQAQALLGAQREAASRAQDTAHAAQLEADKLGLKLAGAVRRRGARVSQAADDGALHAAAAGARIGREVQGADRQVAAETLRRAEAEAAREQRTSVAERKLAQAREGHAVAARRLREKQGFVQSQAEQLRQQQADRTAKRAEAVLQLKASTEGVMEGMRGANERRADKLSRRDAARDAERRDILARGGNPYQVFRQRDEDARLAREQAQIEAKLASNMAAMQARLSRARLAERRSRAKAERDAEAAEAAAREMTAVGAEMKNEAYMRRVTKTGARILDPTSREAALHASKHATFKDWKFGLGLSKDDDVLRMMAERYPTVAAKHAAAAEGAYGGESGELAAPTAGRSALSDLGTVRAASVVAMAADAHERGEVVDEVVEPELAGLWDDRPAVAEADRKRAGREPSTLEKRYMAAARARQRDNLVSTQVVCGTTWDGPAFVASPPVLQFRDFVVGQSYVLPFTLTNVSNGFNMFRPQPLPDDVASFFDLSHEPPGRMVPGRTASLKLTFSPKVATDISAELPLLTQTGMMSLPIRCAPKKVLVAVAAPALYFCSVVLAESAEIALTITNRGALPTRFSASIVPVPSDAAAEATAPSVDQAGGGSKTQHADNVAAEAVGPEEVGGQAGQLASEGERATTGERKASEDANAEDAGRVLGTASTAADLDAAASSSAQPTRSTQALAFTTDQGAYDLAPYSTTTVLLRFSPSAAGEAAATLHLDFGSDWSAERVELSGTGVKVPIHLPRTVVNMRTCVHGAMYRDELKVCNRSSVAQKVSLRTPACLEGCLEFVPVAAFVQARGAMAIQLKFVAEPRLLQTCASYLIAPDTIEVPIWLQVPGQAAPVVFTLRAQLTTSDLHILAGDGQTPLTSLDFGTVPVSARRQMPIVLRNPSALPQRFGFVTQTPELDVQPGDGLGTILPGEQLQLTVSWLPSSDTRFSHALACRTTLNRRHTLKCVGRGVKPPLTLSATSVVLPATAEGDASEAELTLTNESGQPHEFEFAPPPGRGLAVEPLIGKLLPGAAVRVLVTFTAPVRGANALVREERVQGEEGVDKAGGDEAAGARAETAAADGGVRAAAEAVGDAPVGAGVGVGGEAGPSGGDEPWSSNVSSCIPCFMRPAGTPFIDRSTTLFVEVETTTVAPSLLLGNGSVRQTIDFGAVPLGQEEPALIKVRSLLDRPLWLVAQPLAPSGPFSLLNGAPELGPHGAAELFLRFKPTRQLDAVEQLVLSAVGANGEPVRLLVTLKGSGVSPTLKFVPPSPPPAAVGAKGPPVALPGAVTDVPIVSLCRARDSSAIHLGDVLVGEQLTRIVDLANESDFAVKFVLKSVRRGHANLRPFAAFDMSPAEAAIPSGGVQRLTLSFSPDHPGLHFFELFELAMADGISTEGTQLLLLSGRAWSSGGYVLPPALGGLQGEALLSAPAQDVLALAAGSVAAAAGGGGAEAEVMVLELVPGASGAASCELTFGNIKPGDAAAKSSNLEVSFEGLSDEAARRGFSIQPMKMSIEPGTTKQAVFAFELRREALRGTELGLIASFGVSQWAEARVRAVMKGGHPAMAQPELPILMKGFIPKQPTSSDAQAVGARAG
jgi:hypothetical protein